MKRFREPFNLLFRHQTPIEFLGAYDEFSEKIKPTGFIFHLSRCGSTLVSQMLAAVPQNIVISEASPIDFVLRAASIPEEKRIEWLRWVIGAYGQPRNPSEERFFIKFDSWNAIEINLVKRAFPDVPWIFLYRRPVEIIVSHMRQRGAHMVPGLLQEILPELSFDEALKMTPEEYCARVLEKICQSAVDSLENGDGLAVDYTELPAGVWQKILNHFKVAVDKNEVEEMMRATARDAKNPVLGFTADSEKKRQEASPAALAAAAYFVDPLYEKLEKIRKNAEKAGL
jgi:hypothetical protein